MRNRTQEPKFYYVSSGGAAAPLPLTSEKCCGTFREKKSDASDFNALRSVISAAAGSFLLLAATPQKTPQNVITPLEGRMLDRIARTPGITKAKLSRSLGIGEETIKEYIAKLKSKGLLRRIGPDKGGHWEVVPSGALSAGAAAPSALAPSARPRKVLRNHTE